MNVVPSISFHSRPASQWLEENLPGSQIGDKRLRRRLQIIGEKLITQPGASIPKMFPDVSAMESAYNFMNNSKTDVDAIQHDHRELTRQRVRECAGWVLLIQDTSAFSWSQCSQIEGLGPVGPSSGPGGGGQGFFLHSTLAVEVETAEQGDATGQLTSRVLGLANQQFLVRPPAVQGKAERLDRSKGDGEADGVKLESDKWTDGLANLSHSSAEQKPRIVVADREADTWELMKKCREMNYGFCIRAARDRVLVPGEDSERLMEHIRAQPAIASHALYLRARQGKAARTAAMHLSISRQVGLRSPQRPGGRAGKNEPMTVDIVRVWEDGGDRLEWILLVSRPVETAEDALLWTRIYSTRWLIEEYHKALKTGMKAESLQLETGKRLMTTVAVMAVVALRLLALRETARHSPDCAAEQVGLEAEELEVLRTLTKNKPLVNAYDVLMAIGRLGGHLGRKGDGLPGWMTLWTGYAQLKMITTGYLLAKQRKR